MEAPNFSVAAAYSAFSVGPDKPVSNGAKNLEDPRCANEVEFEAADRGIRLLCVAILHTQDGVKYYKPCQFAKGKCPIGKLKINGGFTNQPLEIEKKWARLKANS